MTSPSSADASVKTLELQDAAERSTLRAILREYVQLRSCSFDGVPSDCRVCRADLLAGQVHEWACPVGIAARILYRLDEGL